MHKRWGCYETSFIAEVLRVDVDGWSGCTCPQTA